MAYPKIFERYLEMLRYKRPHNTDGEDVFLRTFIDTIPGMQTDDFGNRWLDVGKDFHTLFSAHVDTMHFQTGLQEVILDQNLGIIYKEDGDCLGADNASGCIVLINLIEKGVPGRYIFHRGEERGRLGSIWIRKNKEDMLKGMHHAVAFDRKDCHSIITNQRGRVCCSDTYANALIKAFGDHKMEFEQDPTGSYTDTASYMDIIPECTNISVGYWSEHTQQELQDITHLLQLLEITPQIDWNNLPVKRVPVPEVSHFTGFRSGAYSSDYWEDGYEDSTDWWGQRRQNQSTKSPKRRSYDDLHIVGYAEDGAPIYGDFDSGKTYKGSITGYDTAGSPVYQKPTSKVTKLETRSYATYAEIERFVEQHPKSVIELLFDYKITWQEIASYRTNSVSKKT